MSAKLISFATGRELERPEASPVKLAKVAPRKQKRGSKEQEQRKSLLAKIHVAKKQLGLDDAEYRAMLEGNFGVMSAASLDLHELERMVFVMRSYGFAPKRGHARRGESKKRDVPALLNAPGGRGDLVAKIEAQLAEKGRIEGTDVPWGYALGILKRQSGGVTRSLDHATEEQLQGVISALARDAKRKGRRVN